MAGLFLPVARSRQLLFVVVAVAVVQSAGGTSILDHGAVANVNTISAAQSNSRAIQGAAATACSQSNKDARFLTASGTSPTGDAATCTIVIPAGNIFYIHPVALSGFVGLTLEVAGELRAHNNISAWPRDAKNKSLDVLSISDCVNVTLTGHGVIDGQGYDWWWWAIIGGVTHLWEDTRPILIEIERCKGVLLECVSLINSPKFHVRLRDSRDLVARHMVIRADVEAQKALLRKHGLMQERTFLAAGGDGERSVEVPTFPLNTDGIDPAVENAHIYNVTIENFDDAVAVKPCNAHPDNVYCNCSSNILVENSTVRLGVGMTIGSVPPNDFVNCVENITFRNIVFHEPLKAVYIKTNPGDHGSGKIRNVTYENLEIIDPVWWGIYIGPQQQQQPGGSGPGCMTYPLENCPTQPRVPMDDITLRNVSMSGGVNPFAGVVRCNVSRPCTGFLFENVHVKEALDTENYIVEYVDGLAVDCQPKPLFKPSSSIRTPGRNLHAQQARPETRKRDNTPQAFALPMQ